VETQGTENHITGGLTMADKCPHCGIGVGPLATKCYKCGGPIDEVHQMMQDRPTLAQREESGKTLLGSIIFGILGILLSPLIWIFTLDLTTSAICSMYIFSGIFGLGAFVSGLMMLKNKDARGWIGLIMGIVTGIMILIPIVWVMITPFGG